MKWTLVLTLAVCTAESWGQRRVDPFSAGERVLAVVPMVGTGRVGDPRRPMFAPVNRDKPDPKGGGITGFRYVLSDDGRFALVEFTARDRRGLDPVIKHGRTDVVAFEKGKPGNGKAAVELEFKKYRKDFDYDRFVSTPGLASARPASLGGVR